MFRASNERKTLLGAADELNVSNVLELLLARNNPNLSATAERSDVSKTLFHAFLDRFSNVGAKDQKQFKNIAQLLWVFKGVLDNKKPFRFGTDYLKDQRAELTSRFPGVFDFNDPVLCLCYAVHSALIDTQLEGYSNGSQLFQNMLTSLIKNQTSGLEYLIGELKRTQPTFFWTQHKISLDSENFQTAVLRTILHDENLLKTLDIKIIPVDLFNQDSSVRNNFRETLIQKLSNYLIGSSDIIACDWTL